MKKYLILLIILLFLVIFKFDLYYKNVINLIIIQLNLLKPENAPI